MPPIFDDKCEHNAAIDGNNGIENGTRLCKWIEKSCSLGCIFAYHVQECEKSCSLGATSINIVSWEMHATLCKWY